jgi:hypothetical protein
MPIDVHPKRRGPTSDQVVAEQKAQAKALQEQKRQHSAVPAKVEASTPAPATIDTRTLEERYVDEIAPSSFAGERIRFTKEAKVIVGDSDEEIGPDVDLVALLDETLVGWVRFNGEGEMPTRIMGPLYGGFKMPERSELGDTDPALWKPGLSNAPEDPWHHTIYIVLQNPATQTIYTFTTSSKTGRRACGVLFRHYNRMRRNDKDHYPIVHLRPSGYEDERYGWVNTPSFVILGRIPKNSTMVPDTSVAADMNDSIPI